MSNTCKNCRHWNPLSLSHMLSSTQVLSQKRGKCEMADSSCEGESSDHSDKVPPNYFGVEVSGGDTWGVDWEFVTGPDFGCNQFEKRGDQAPT
jgi:hypothetical protein